MQPQSTRFVTHYWGSPSSVVTGPATTATANLGDVIVFGRPYPVGQPVALDANADQRHIESALRSLDGRFSLLAVGVTRAVLATDSLGCGGAYLAGLDGPRIMVASHLGLAAAALSRGREVSFDPIGSVSALIGSFCVGHRTAYQGIRRLRACEYAIIDIAEQQCIGIHSYATVPEIFDLDEQGLGSPSELSSLLQAAVSRECGTPALFLSGGKDSGAIALSLPPERRHTTTAITYGGWRSRDRRRSVSVARSLEMRHRLVGPLRLKLQDFADPIIRYGGGLTSLQAAEHFAGSQSAGAFATVALSGFLGDVLSGHPYEDDRELQAALTINRHTSWLRMNPAIDFDAAFPEAMVEIREALTRTWQEFSYLGVGLAGQITDLTHRQAHYICGQFDIIHQHIEIATPFFFRPLIHYLLTRSPQQLLHQRLYKQALTHLGKSSPTPIGPLGFIGTSVDRFRRPYATYNRRAVMRRSRGWLVRMLRQHQDHLIGRLGRQSLATDSELPLALIAVPLLVTARPTRASRGS